MVFIQQEFDSKLIESIAKELGVRMVVINRWEETGRSNFYSSLVH